MSKSNRVLASGIALALVFAAGVTQAAPPARTLNTVTFTQTIHPSTADRGKLQARNGADRDLGGWAKADGLQVTWDVAEYRSGSKIDALDKAKPAQTETLEISHAGFLDATPAPAAAGEPRPVWIELSSVVKPPNRGAHDRLATLQSVHAGLRRNDIAIEAIAIQHEGLPKPQAAFNPKELTVDKSVPWIRNAQPHADGAVGGDRFNGKYLVQGVTHR